MTQVPVAQHVEVGRHNGSGKLLVGTHHHHVHDERRLLHLLFNHLGVDIFAHRGLEHALRAAGYEEVAVGVKEAGVAGVEPAVFVDGLRRQLGLVVVAFHHVAAAALYLVGLRVYAHFDFTHCEAHRANLAAFLVAVRHCDKRRAFGEAVTLIEVQSHAREEAREARLDGGAAADEHVQLTAHALANLFIYQLVGKFLLYFVPAAEFALVEVVLERQVDGPVEYFFAHAAHLLALAEDLVVHLLDEPRHAGHHVGAYLLAVVAHLGYALGIGDGEAEPLVEVAHHALVDVAHRQPREGFRPGLSGAFLDFLHVHDEAAVRQHCPFGHAGGAAGVYHGADVVGGQRVLDGLQLCGSVRVLGHVAAPDFVDVIYRFHALHRHYRAEVLQLRQLLADVADFLVQAGVLHHQQAHLRVVQYVLVVLLADGGVDGQQHGTCLLHAEVHIVPLGAAGTYEADVLALLHAQMHQRIAYEVDFLYVLVNKMLFPFAVFLEFEHGTLWVKFFPPL